MEIKFNDVEFNYSKNLEKVLNKINLQFKKGEINGIIGQNGSGKTTLIEMINALNIPTNGFVQVDDFLVEKKNRIKKINDLRKNVGLVFQFPEEQIFNNTVQKELEFSLKTFNYDKERSTQLINEALNMVGLDNTYANRDPFTLSDGEMRKVALASILIYDPKVIILDEPTIGLDNASKKNFIKIIKDLKRKYKKTIIVVSHDVDMMLKLVDYIFVLNNGKIVLEGTKYEVFTEEKKLNDLGISIPKIIEFENLVQREKGIKLGYRDEINDLIKDIFRYAK